MKRALLVGIDAYKSFPKLSGCVKDVEALLPLLSEHESGDPNFECETPSAGSDGVDRKVLISALDRLLAPGADVALLYFAGHGIEDKGDVVLASVDGTQKDPGVPLASILADVQESKIPEVIIILDCCFSGNAGGSALFGKDVAAVRQGVTLLTASRGDQTAEEGGDAGHGVFTSHLCAALQGGAADVLGKVKIAGVYAYVVESFGAFDQRPMFKANVDRLHELRRCAPAVPLADLRRLPEIFPFPEFEKPLDPSYEPTVAGATPENMKVFSVLQKCRAARLVEPIGVDHMYDAAMQNKPCRLTPLGRHYRALAVKKRI